MNAVASTVFCVPPFPGARPCPIVAADAAPLLDNNVTARNLVETLRRARVGGNFWSNNSVWAPTAEEEPVRAAGDAPLLLLGAIARRPLIALSEGPFSALAAHANGSSAFENELEGLVERYLLRGVRYMDPFDGSPISLLALIDILGNWRALIEANRPVAAAFGFAHWKRDTVDPLLWGGHPVSFRAARSSELFAIPPDAAVAVWKARVPPDFLEQLERGPWRLLEVEDGFIRSAGLGADCIPPLSIVVDDLGVHYDRTRPNRLEEMLAQDDLSQEEGDRARNLREWIVRSGVSKYAAARGEQLPRLGAYDQPHILVVGQVEDDRSVLFGSGKVRSNLALLQRVRETEPNAWIIYRPHPDIEAGHRKGAIPERLARELANQIEPDQPISALIALVDQVHVMTSLAGFEALLQGKAVTTHGTPFYAGWGLTRDLASVPERRGKQLTIDRLTASVLLRYPRYLDPVTGLPCTPELLVKRLISGVQRQNAALVPIRRLAGWAKRATAKLVGTR